MEHDHPHTYELPQPVSSPPTSQRSRFSLRISLSSFLGGSSLYSNSPRLVGSPQHKPDIPRFSINSLRDARLATRTMATPRTMRSRSSTRSLIEPTTLPMPPVQPLSLQRTWYDRPRAPGSTPPIEHMPSPTFSTRSVEEVVLEQEARQTRRHRRKCPRRYKLFSRDAFKDPKVYVKASMSVAFGVTLFATIAVYLGLAIANIGSGPVYHTLFILIILALASVFIHCLLRMFMLILRPRPSRPGLRTRRRNRQATSRTRIDPHKDPADGFLPEKPIRIIMAADEEVDEEATIGEFAAEKLVIRHPPPVYGEFRTSTRINPNLVHWQKQPPSPLTPTYDEAISDVQRALGFRPPSYISQTGETVGISEGTQPRPAVLEDVHPLERERVRELIGIAR